MTDDKTQYLYDSKIPKKSSLQIKLLVDLKRVKTPRYLLRRYLSKTHLCSIVKRSHVKVLTLTTWYTIHLQINKFFGGMFKGLTDTVKCKDDRYILSRSKKCILRRNLTLVKTPFHSFVP